MKKELVLFDETTPEETEQEDLTKPYVHQTYNPIARQREAETQQREAYKAYQDAIQKAGSLKSDITKGILQGDQMCNLFLKALYCIGLMCGESLFYEQNKENLIAIYGVGFLESAPLEIELDEVRKRLALLTRPELLESESPETMARINAAIERHKTKEEHLVKQIG